TPMMSSKRLVFGIVTLILGACSGSEDPIEAEERCLADGLTAYAEGMISNDSTQISLDLSTNSIDGSIGIQQVSMELGTISRPGKPAAPLRMLIHDAHSVENLLDTFTNATNDGPLTLNVFDASELASGSSNRTELSHLDCGLQNGNVCVQLGFDTTGDELILDDDDGAYNGISGTVTIKNINHIGRKLHFTWNLEVGSNILAFQDQSFGRFKGCVNATYETGTAGRWVLR
ncbi:MAG: hypothetical protein ACNA8W_22730, partial [Bradymonadaceae bacterium]